MEIINSKPYMFLEHEIPRIEETLNKYKILEDSTNIWEFDEVLKSEKIEFPPPDGWESALAKDDLSSLFPEIPTLKGNLSQVTKLPFKDGVKLLSGVISHMHSLRFGDGFEEILEKVMESMNCTDKIFYLETSKDMETHTISLDQLFKAALKKSLYKRALCKLIDNKDGVELIEKIWKEAILKEFRQCIREHQHELCSRAKADNIESTRKRNELWKGVIKGHLETSSAPILVICGNSHLKGCMDPQCGGLLLYLKEIEWFSTIKRIDLSGNIINY